MNVADIVQIVANVGVVASIVLLAFQIRQNNKIMAATASGVLVTQSTSHWAMLTEQPEIAELLVKDREGEALTAVQEMRANSFWMRSLFNVEYAFHVFHRAPQKQRFVKAMQRAALSYGSLWRTWNGPTGAVAAGKDLFSPEFSKFMDENVFNAPGAPAPASKVSTP